MRLLKCPKPDALFEFVSIPSEVSPWSRMSIKLHALACPPCQEKMNAIQAKWDAYFIPEPDITSSLIKVYSRLQKDETLVLKGWKLGRTQQTSQWGSGFLKQGWLFRGAVSLGLGSVAILLVTTQVKSDKAPMTAAVYRSAHVPLAQFRVEDKNSIKVHYVQPELLQSMEFETTSASTGR